MFSNHSYVVALLLLGLLSPVFLVAQAPDTSDFYYRLHEKAKKRTLTRWIYEGVFKVPARFADTSASRVNVQTVNPFLAYQGKTIRQVRIVSFDPFGYSVNDTSVYTLTNLEKLGNRYHINTRKYIIRNILLFHNNDALDPLELSESERLIRLYPYVNDARIYVHGIESNGNSDSVDVTVMVQDKWSTLVGSSLDINQPNIRFVERNLFGLGHQLEEGITWKPAEDNISTFGKYTIFNIGNTFINSSVFYSMTAENNQWGVSFDRPFYSALAKWAGGASYVRNYSHLESIQNDIQISYPVNNQAGDFWVAKNFPATTRKTASINKRSDNYVIGLRYYQLDYTTQPPFVADSNRIYSDQIIGLNNIGFSKRKYYKDRFLYRFGANEDIPQGYSIEYVHGILKKEYSQIWYYAGVKLAKGQHYDHIGYLSAGISCGTFYTKQFFAPGVLNADLYYFTDLFSIGDWYFRQFVRWQYVQGINRLSYESVNINGGQMYGFSSETLNAKSKMLLNFELVLYAPYQVLGFKFAPVVLCGLGRLGNDFNSVFNSYTYQAYALGLLIRNEHLIVNTFQISVGLYPYIPDNGLFLFKLNPVSGYGVRARDYNIGKPELVPY